MTWIQILISIPAAVVAVAFVRVGWFVAKDMDWLSPTRGEWSDIPLGLRVTHQGSAFVVYLIYGVLRSVLFGSAFACGWMIFYFRREPALVCLFSLGLVICLGIMWTAAQAQYEEDRRRGPLPKEFD